jgi:hypothetical protein
MTHPQRRHSTKLADPRRFRKSSICSWFFSAVSIELCNERLKRLRLPLQFSPQIHYLYLGQRRTFTGGYPIRKLQKMIFSIRSPVETHNIGSSAAKNNSSAG